MEKFRFLQNQMDELADADLLRGLTCIDSAQGPIVTFTDGTSKVLLCSNNYLNIASDPEVIAAVIEAVGRYGYGSAASRLISGTMKPHIDVEQAFADLLCKEAALLFGSGWGANQAVITTIPQKGDLILLDKLSHASIIDAAKESDAQFRTYRGDRLEKLQRHLADDRYSRKFIITESIFSMDGHTADLKALVELRNAHDAILIVDEAHAIGCVGKSGAGLAEHLGLLDQVDIVVAPLGKAVAATGAIVASRKVVIDHLINKARPFIYTTAPSPVNCAAILTALKIIKTQPDRRNRLTANADYLRSKLRKIHLDTSRSTTHIVPVIIGNAKDTLDIAQKLYDAGFFAAAIRPPTVPAKTARLRICLQCDHTKDQLDALVAALDKFAPADCRTLNP